MKKLSIFLVTSLVIGNVISWLMGAWPIDFAKLPYSSDEKTALKELKTELKTNPDDVSLLVEIASMQSLHNEIEPAGSLLDRALKLAPEDPQVVAWHNANNAKISGTILDFGFGLYKMHKLSQACDGLSKAVDMAPNDLTVRMLRLATFANIGKINSHFDEVFDDEQWFNKLFTQAGAQLPSQVKSQFYLYMAQAYLNRADAESVEKLNHYLQLYRGSPSSAEQDNQQFQDIQTSFAAMDRGSSWK